MVPCESTLRMRLLPVSAIYVFPAPSIVTGRGVVEASCCGVYAFAKKVSIGAALLSEQVNRPASVD